jgi:hypothetical protein
MVHVPPVHRQKPPLTSLGEKHRHRPGNNGKIADARTALIDTPR